MALEIFAHIDKNTKQTAVDYASSFAHDGSIWCNVNTNWNLWHALGFLVCIKSH